jgi:cephalosporin hydroxylase
MIGEMCKSPNAEYVVELKKKMKCGVYVEIGVLYGGSIIEQMKDEQECIFVGIDLFTGYYGKSYDPHRKIDLTDHYNIVNNNIMENNPHNHKYHLIKGKSEDVVEDFKNLNLEIDYLFIDGDHSYQGVMNDYNNYLPFVKKGGIIVFDNYNDEGWKQVTTAVNEILDNSNDITLVEKYTKCCVVKKI